MQKTIEQNGIIYKYCYVKTRGNEMTKGGDRVSTISQRSYDVIFKDGCFCVVYQLLIGEFNRLIDWKRFDLEIIGKQYEVKE